MGRTLIHRQWGHPAFALVGVVVFGCASVLVGRSAIDLTRQYVDADDPVRVTDRALDRVFSESVATREIQSALAAGDAELAQSFLDLAGDRNVTVDPGLADKVHDASAKAGSVSNTVGRFVEGLWTGEPHDLSSLAGTAFGDLFVFGDIRDLTREGTHYLRGQPTDFLVLGLASAGLVITAGTYSSLGIGAPARAGFTLVKAARRTGRLNPALMVRVAREAVKVEKAGGLVDLVSDVGRIETKAGSQAALDSLQIAEEPRDVSRLARLSAAKGGKTRAIIKLLGRGAILLAVTAFDVATWLIWAALAVLGFMASCKATAERMTLRYIHWRKGRIRTGRLHATTLPLAA
jgi:hypothetical protein